ncbi:hypothetical protein N9X06_06510, partial [Paracoccaceae bacterium]|nr:hypothetical protein [Paracoccaceae bacterium]
GQDYILQTVGSYTQIPPSPLDTVLHPICLGSHSLKRETICDQLGDILCPNVLKFAPWVFLVIRHYSGTFTELCFLKSNNLATMAQNYKSERRL